MRTESEGIRSGCASLLSPLCEAIGIGVGFSLPSAPESCQVWPMFFHPGQAELEIERAATSLQAGLDARKREGWCEDDHGPLQLFRSVTTRERLAQIQQLPPALDNKEALLRWQAYLTIERVTWEDRVLAEVARQTVEHPVAGLGDLPWSIRSLVLQIIVARNEAMRSRCAHGLTVASREASTAAVRWSMRRHAAACYLGIGPLRWLEAPVRGSELSCVVRSVFDATEDVALASMGEGNNWEHSLWLGTAADARHGWPAVLTPRWFRSVFGGWKPLEGLRIELGPLCDAVCGASFARALERFGTAVYRACVRRTGDSFSRVHLPFDMGPACYGALFASLLTSIPFLKRRLGLGTSAAKEQAWSLGLSLLLSLRMCAAQGAVADAESPEEMMERHVWGTARALCASVPEETLGVVPRYDPEAQARLCGALRAAMLQRELVERFDDDWFDNPRAHEFLVSIDRTERTTLDGEHLGGALLAAKELFVSLFHP